MKKPADQNEDEWETHLILRVPNEVVPDVDNFIENGRQYGTSKSSEELSSTMALKILPNMRTGQLKINDKTLGFRVQDLPCILETYKTHDKTNIYKVADIAQIINCSSSPEIPDILTVPEGDKDDPEVAAALAKRKKMLQFQHGITRPMKNARKWKFRKTKKMKSNDYMDASQIDKEIKRLLRMDLEAISIRYEAIDVD